MQNSIFRKTLECPPKQYQLQNEFQKLKNGKKVTLSITDDKIYILYEHGTLKYAEMDYELRFQLKKDNNIEHGVIYLLVFEKDNQHPVEFFSKNCSIMNWRLLLKEKLNMIDYQLFYSNEKLLGSGSFASVYLFKRKADKHLFAAKSFYKVMLYKDPKSKSMIRNEIGILRLLTDHSYIIKLFEVFENKAQVYLILELASQGTLSSLLLNNKRGLPLQFVNKLFTQVLMAVCHMHSKQIMHRDIKPSNILFRTLGQAHLEISDVSIALTDFGIATHISQLNKIYHTCGSPGYTAPEVYVSEDYDEKCDIFSLGCLYYEMVHGRRVFKGKTKEELVDSNKLCQINYSGLGSDLLRKMLAVNGQDRPSAIQLLQHFQQKNMPRPLSTPHKQFIQKQQRIKTDSKTESNDRLKVGKPRASVGSRSHEKARQLHLPPIRK